MGLLGSIRRLFRRKKRRGLFGQAPDVSAPVITTTTPVRGSLEFAADDYSVLETYGKVVLLVNRTDGYEGPISVTYTTVDGTAVAGVDYTATSGTLNWADKDGDPKAIVVPIAALTATGNFVFTVKLLAITGGADFVDAVPVANVTILRRSHGEADFTPGQWYMQEPGVPTNVAVTVQRNLAFKGPVGVSWHTVDGSALAGLDYTAGSGTLSWADGDGFAKTINVSVLFRAGAQADRSFNIVIDTPTGSIVIGTGSTANVIISDSAVPANPTVTASILSQVIDDMFFNAAEILVAFDEMYVNRNILVNSANGNSLARRFNGIYAFNATIVWAVGNLGYITSTANGGGAWTPRTSGVNTDLYAVTFITALIGWAVGAGGVILKSIDGGVTWVAQTSGITTDLYAVRFFDSLNGWAVGAGGVILFTGNGGTTWTAQTSGTTNALRGVGVLSATIAFAVGDLGTILISAGATWTPQASGVALNLNGVHIVDSTHGWAVGNQGTILFYNGTLWAAQTSGVSVNLNSISMASTIVGWAVGNTGTILKTANGSTWAAQTAAVVENLVSISAATTAIAFLTGPHTIQTTGNGGTLWSSSLATIYATFGFGGMSTGGSSATGGVDIISTGESFLPVTQRNFQGHMA